ncbi:MAG: indolepyruvate oxidoreductase subunit beta [Candidatus Zophobacter franzmannii]|nr:indolepyruvate oxidoreductase subunit beta [Candidatus Zophobacter franzmannii]
MKINIILAGVGGQGILTIAKVFGQVAVKQNLFLKQAEVHGMSQRGGDVQSNLRISDKEIFSDLIPEGEADLIISVEPMESLRYLPLLAPDGWLITNAKPFVNIPNYPEIETVYNEVRKVKNHVIIDAQGIAKEIGNVLASNIVMLGAAAEKTCFSMEQLEVALHEIFISKGEKVVDLNVKALRAGNEAKSL